MKSFFTALILSLFAMACNTKQDTPNSEKGLPYYHTPDFTPLWNVKSDTIHTLADFSFNNQNGETITSNTFKGKIHVASFFFTICPSLCPKIMGNMHAVQKNFLNDKDVLIASYSVMPERDSVSVLSNYAKTNNIVTNKWQLLTGNKKEVYEIARRSYFADENLGVQKGENDFLHTENFILIDKNLHIRGIYNGTLQLEIEQLIKDIEELKKE